LLTRCCFASSYWGCKVWLDAVLLRVLGSHDPWHLLRRDMDLMKVISLRCAPPLQSDLLISVALQVR